MDKELKMYQTKDYAKFKFLEYNRTTTTTKALKESIEQCDMTAYAPIIVTRKYEIIDGQNRFVVCRELNKPVTYVFYDGIPEYAMIKLNTVVRQWKNKDWLEYYVGKGNPTYIKFKNLQEKTNTTLANAIVLFSQAQTNSKSFNNGNLKDNSDYMEAISEYINDCAVPATYKGFRPFVTAIQNFYLRHKDDKKQLMKAARKCSECYKFATTAEYERTFENYLL